MEEIRICLTGGSTGGHFFPLIFVAKKFKEEMIKRNWSYKIFYLGAQPFDEELMKKENIQIFKIPAGKLRKYFDIMNILDIFKFPFGFMLAFFRLYILMPNIIFSKGGFGSFEVVLAGWLLRIPIIVHESDSIPGRSNILAGKFATLIGVNFEETKNFFNPKKTALIGQPLNPDFNNIKPTLEDYQKFNLNPNEKIILVLGGSQGSQKINDTIIFSLHKLLTVAQVVHQLGKNMFEEYSQIASGFILENIPMRKNLYHPFPFLDNYDLIKLIKMSNLIIARAGAGTIFELAACGKPSILIPLRREVGGEHQIKNAYNYADSGAAIVIEEQNLFPDLLATIIIKTLKDENLLEEMSKNALNFSKTDATDKIVKEIIILLNK
ncbi:MAG: UDP-N-acetylglucosamine--N-acetylmuramyl-(pentapeptide) pyrophosphoryl-undecaprenol N-acetylglucosamine transferase [Candidatus Parcubacteria bacterium]|nr:MAG: UDP-N-acetylglucosamine--N-acetylmuramyl-(pentapeptide) pyrophosphoryl-undecaprenol N-acetylglucosamine transferase [Candidatus Parcubacteria bacterium]